jgi:hypothetical protein
LESKIDSVYQKIQEKKRVNWASTLLKEDELQAETTKEKLDKLIQSQAKIEQSAKDRLLLLKKLKESEIKMEKERSEISQL